MADLVLSSFQLLKTVPPQQILTVGESVPLPKFSAETLHQLTHEVFEKMDKKHPFVNIEPGVVVVGDIHGNIYDLLRIMNNNGYPPKTRYLFLGDYVDRGEYSVEVISFLLSMLVLFPEEITLLRGNHEFRSINSMYGFRSEIMTYYNDDELYKEFNDIFDYLPVAALVGTNIFAVHGGISDKMKYIQELNNIQFPITDDTGIIGDLVWSDPDKKIYGFADNPRGNGIKFGTYAFEDFLKMNSLTVVIRGHQCVFHGYECMFKNRFLTIFSSSSYAYDFPNSAAYATISINSEVKPVELELIPIRKKDKCFTFDVVPMSHKPPTRCLSMLQLHNHVQARRLSASSKQINGINKMKRQLPKSAVKPKVAIRKSLTLESFTIPEEPGEIPK